MRIRLLVAALSLGVLTACSGGAQEPEALPPVSSAPSAAASLLPLPSPSLTGRPGEVEAALLAYYAAINSAFATGDTAAYSATHTEACVACRQLTELLASTAAKGQRFEGAQDEVLSYAIQDLSGPNAVADVRFRVTPYSLVDSQGAVLETYKPEERRNLVAFNLVGGAWKVVGVTQVDA